MAIPIYTVLPRTVLVLCASVGMWVGLVIANAHGQDVRVSKL